MKIRDRGAGSRRKASAVAISRKYAVETNPHADPLPFTKGAGNIRWHDVQVTEQGSEKGAFQLSSPRSERGEDQGEGRFRLHTYCLGLVQKTSAGQEAYFEQNDPHPDPLPSDGRGNSQPRLRQLPKRLDTATDGLAGVKREFE